MHGNADIVLMMFLLWLALSVAACAGSIFAAWWLWVAYPFLASVFCVAALVCLGSAIYCAMVIGWID